eukprot:TRINITY_DN2988_c0_g5_i3.p1 TRINITY_DN2988_c0_g5~~TRINITY_DN2988_c0_g5_i3.p1  ORF type:complete len:599 (+),score=76.35 TRINITY_DN2988_c0_g5_i3:74-1870(+)
MPGADAPRAAPAGVSVHRDAVAGPAAAAPGGRGAVTAGRVCADPCGSPVAGGRPAPAHDGGKGKKGKGKGWHVSPSRAAAAAGAAPPAAAGAAHRQPRLFLRPGSAPHTFDREDSVSSGGESPMQAQGAGRCPALWGGHRAHGPEPHCAGGGHGPSASVPAGLLGRGGHAPGHGRRLPDATRSDVLRPGVRGAAELSEPGGSAVDAQREMVATMQEYYKARPSDLYKAVELIHKCSELAVQIAGDESLVYAEFLHEECVMRRRLGDLDGALPCIIKALDIRRKRLGVPREDLAASIHQFAIVLLEQNEPAQAIPAFRESIELWGGDAAGTGCTAASLGWEGLGRALHATGSTKEALEAHQTSLRIRLSGYGEKHVRVAYSRMNIGICLRELGETAEALKFLLQALDGIKEAPGYGAACHDAAIVHEQLGETYELMGKHEEARAHHHAAYSVRVAVLGPDHQLTEQSHMKSHAAVDAVEHATPPIGQAQWPKPRSHDPDALSDVDSDCGGISCSVVGDVLADRGVPMDVIKLFRKEGVDGAALSLLTDHDLEHQFKIQSKDVRCSVLACSAFISSAGESVTTASAAHSAYGGMSSVSCA